MPNPEDVPIKTYLIIMALSLWGGIANFINRLRTTPDKRFSIAEFIGELTISGFTGIVTYYLCASLNLNPLLTAALVGISGHMGSRFIFKLELYIEVLVNNYTSGLVKEPSNIITDINIRGDKNGSS